ncbi:MAG: hypothetical protein RJQ01_07940 [Microcella sp.]|uniref:hypothetical protein n=1 Tax=Microcella sp. TaxID=1913979 RepID=UPI00331573BC
MAVKLSGRLPEADRSGLDLLQGELVRHPEARHLVVAVIDCARTTVDHGDNGDTYTPTAGVIFIEPVQDQEDIEAVLEVMGRVRAERVDGGTLDFDFGVGDPLATTFRREGEADDA